jgi:hypothetical protein
VTIVVVLHFFFVHQTNAEYRRLGTKVDRKEALRVAVGGEESAAQHWITNEQTRDKS